MREINIFDATCDHDGKVYIRIEDKDCNNEIFVIDKQKALQFACSVVSAVSNADTKII